MTRKSARKDYWASKRLDIPEHIPLSQHVGQVMVLGTFPNQQKIEITYVNKATRQLHYKTLTKN